MQPIKMSHNSPDLESQLSFLIKREFFVRYNRYKRPAYYLLGWIIFLILFSYLTGENLIVLKGVLLTVTAIALIPAAGFAAIIFFRLLKRNTWKRTTVLTALKSDKITWITFDDDQISFSSETYTTHVKWDHYKYYREYNNSLFIFSNSLYETLACSRSEFGEQEYESLKIIVSKKLAPLV
jgi:hypothetical protein